MFNWLGQRSEAKELMDDFSMGGADLREALRHLRRLNRIFAAAGPTLFGVEKLWTEAGKPRELSILDIGAGSGDVNRILLPWAEMNNLELTITIADVTEEACKEARLLFQKEKRVRIIRCDLFELPEGCADLVTATQFVHHFSSEELPGAVRAMLHASRIGIVINDIHRHWIAWLAVWLAVHGISRNRYIRHDGPLSVAKGFTSSDWEELSGKLNDCELFYWWKPLFRYVVTGGK